MENFLDTFEIMLLLSCHGDVVVVCFGIQDLDENCCTSQDQCDIGQGDCDR